MLTYKKNGYSLVETLVAISILLIAMVGPLTIASKALQASYFAREQTTATFLAQEGLEIIVSIRNDSVIDAIASGNLDDSWDWADEANIGTCFAAAGCNTHSRGNGAAATRNFVDCGSGDCKMYFDTNYPNDPGSGPYGLHTLIAKEVTKYTRVITLEKGTVANGDEDVVYVTSTVTWPARAFNNEALSVTLHSALYNIYD